VDFRNRRITVEKTKNSERRILSLSDTAFQALKSLPRAIDSNMSIFPGISGPQLTLAFKRACLRADVENFRFHDLRHSFGSWLIMKGADLRTVQTLMGHKDLRMTLRYTHLSPDHLQGAVNLMDGALSIPDGKEPMIQS